MAKHINISPEALEALRRGCFSEPAGGSKVNAWVFRFAPEDARLDRKIYEAANKGLEAAGGKWNRKMKGHLFTRDPREALGLTLETGKAVNLQQVRQLFPTPVEIARDLVELARIERHHRVLEPSAGTGRLLDELPRLDHPPVAIELDPDLAKDLRAWYDGTAVLQGDFLEWASRPQAQFDRVVMNPPFERGSDVKHVLAAYSLLKPGGRLVAIVSGGPKPAEKLAPMCDSWQALPPGAFKSEGTGVATVLLSMTKPSQEQRERNARYYREECVGGVVDAAGNVHSDADPGL